MAFTRYQAIIYYAAVHYPAFLDVLRLPHISWYFTASFSPAPSIAYIFHLGFNVCLPGILGLLIRLVLAFTRYQAMIYYAAVHYPAFLDVLRLPHISWYFTASFSPAPSIAYIFHVGFNVYLPGILALLIRLVLAFTRYQAMIYYAAVHYPAFLDVLRLPHISWYFTASFSPAPSIAYIFHLGFNVYLPGILALLIRLVLAFTRYQAMIYYAAVHYPAFLDVLRLPHISWYFTASFSPAPSIAYIFHLGFNVYLPGILGILICLVLAFTRYQPMIYYAAVHYPAFLDVLRLPHISWYFTASFSPAPSIAYIFHLGFNVYLPGILGLLICLVLAFTRYQATIYYAALPSDLRFFSITLHFLEFYSKLFTCPFHSLHFSFGFQRLPSRHSWPIDSLGPSFHSLPSYDLLRSCALPSVFRCFEITSHFMVLYSKLFTCPFHSLHFSFGFQRLPSRHSWPIDSLGPSFHSLPSYDLLRSCALPSVFRCFEITSHFMVFYSKLFTCPFHSLHFSFGFQRLPWYFTASFSPAPSIAYIFHLGFNVYLPGILGLLICLVLAFTRYQAMIYYAAVHYPAFLDVLRLPHISWYFTASFSPAPSIAYIFHLGFNVYLPGILGILIRLVLAFTRYQAMIYYAAVHYPAFLDVLRLPHIS